MSDAMSDALGTGIDLNELRKKLARRTKKVNKLARLVNALEEFFRLHDLAADDAWQYGTDEEEAAEKLRKAYKAYKKEYDAAKGND